MTEETKKIKQYAFFESYSDALKTLPDKDAGILIKAMCSYVFNGEEPKLTNNMIKAMFGLIKPNLDTSIKMSKIRPNKPNQSGKNSATQ